MRRIVSLCCLSVPLFLLFSACSPWGQWRPGRPDDDAYSAAGFGYSNSYYTPYNLDAVNYRLTDNAAKGGLISRRELVQVRTRLLRSRAIADYRNTEAVKNYISHYKKTISAKQPNFNEKIRGAGGKKYFDMEEYNRFVPFENVNTLIRLKRSGLIAMTRDIEREMKLFYDRYNIKTGSEIMQPSYYYDTKSQSVNNYSHYGYSGENSSGNSLSNSGSSVVSKKRRLNAYLLDHVY